MKLPDGNQLLHQVEFSGRLFTNKRQENFTLVSNLSRKRSAARFQKRRSFPFSYPLVSRFPAYAGIPETRMYFRPWTLSQPAPTALFGSLETWPTETSIASAIAVALERQNSTQLRKTASGSAGL
jgi:hypothetical protein